MDQLSKQKKWNHTCIRTEHGWIPLKPQYKERLLTLTQNPDTIRDKFNYIKYF